MKPLCHSKKEQGEAESIIRRWWSGLQDPDLAGDRAKLRRAVDNPLDALMVESFHRLFNQLKDFQPDVERLAEAAVLIARIKERDGLPVAKRMGGKGDRGQDRRVSSLRFKRLLSYGDDERKERLGALCRMLGLIDHKADPADLALSLYDWGENVRKRWTMAYYGLHLPETEMELSPSESTNPSTEAPSAAS